MNQNGTLQPNSEFPQIGPDNQQNACAYTNYDSTENFCRFRHLKNAHELHMQQFVTISIKPIHRRVVGEQSR